MFGLSDNCTATAKYTPISINIALHFMLLFSVLSCLFYFLISKVEISSINSELRSNINSIISNITQNPTIYSYVNGGEQNAIAQKLKLAYMNPDPVVTYNNNWLYRALIIANSGIFLVILIVVLLIMFKCGECVPIGSILLENLGTFILVGIIEGLFFLKVASKFIPIKPELVTNTFIQEVKNNLV
jgi:hypothetical protein